VSAHPSSPGQNPRGPYNGRVWGVRACVCARVRAHRGRHAKIFGWAKSAAYDRRYTNEHTGQLLVVPNALWPTQPKFTYVIILKQFPK